MKAVKHTIIPFDYPADYNEWVLLMGLELDKLSGTDVVLRAICQEAQTENLIAEAYEILSGHAKR